MLSTKLKEAAGNSADATLYVDDVFSTYLYTGNGSTQTITNGIDLAGKGGLVWIKNRTSAANHLLYDTASDSYGFSNLTATFNPNSGLFVPSTTGVSFTVNAATVNTSGNNYASWTFRKAAKFFDVVTWTGDGVDGRSIAHNLGVSPGIIIIKRTDSGSNWKVSLKGIYNLCLNLTNGEDTTTFAGGVSGSYTSTTFNLYSYSGIISSVNASGGTYVAYLFAHDTSSTGIIQCGSFTVSGNVASVNLGWEPQYIISKGTSSGASWDIFDTMRGWDMTSSDMQLMAQSSAAEVINAFGNPTATGFNVSTWPDGTYIYMAIRRPNKPPTSGTQVFSPLLSTGTTGQQRNTGFVVDSQWFKYRPSAGMNTYAFDRLRGISTNTTESGRVLYENRTDAEANDAATLYFNNTGFQQASGFANANDYIYWNFKRAPGFFDEVCWTGTSATAQQINHSLGVAPELIITKRRDAVSGWPVYNKTITASKYLILQDERASATGSTLWENTEPTASVFTAGQTVSPTNATIVAYLFATLAGISKVGSYTGNGTGQAIACGFSAGAMFVLIKRIDAAGDWYTFDSARGLTSGSSPYLLLNSTAAETTGNNGVYASTGGFTLGSTASTTTNINGASYIYLSVA